MQTVRKRNSVDLLHGSIYRSLLRFAVPFIISTLFQQLYNTVDVMIVGNILGEEALAAIGACSPIYNLLIGFAVGMGNGLAVVAARAFGKGDSRLLRRSIAMGIMIAAGLAVLLTVLAQLGTTGLLRLLQTPEEALSEATAYISTITGFLAVTITYNLCSSMLRAVGDSVAPMGFLMLSSLLNIGLDILLIRFAGMGVRGAAVATVISQGVSASLTLLYIRRKHTELIPEKSFFRRDRPLFTEMFTQGLSMALMSSIVNLGTVILQYSINSMGYLVIAGHTAARQIFTFANIPFISVGHAMSTFSSQNCGAGQYGRIRKGIRSVAKMELVLTLCVVAVLHAFVPALARWLTGSQEPLIIDNCSRYVRFFCPFFAILGSLFTLRFALQGLGEKKLPLISSCIELVIKVLFTLLLVPRFGYDAVIVCEPLIWTMMTMQLIFVFRRNPNIRNAQPSE